MRDTTLEEQMSANEVAEQTGSDNTVVRAFQVGFPEAEVADASAVTGTRYAEEDGNENVTRR